MNYDLAMMALDGLARTPITVSLDGTVVTINGPSAGLKELARLLLLISSESGEDAVELQPNVHVTKGSAALRLVVS